MLMNKSRSDVLFNNASQQIECKDLAEINMDNVEDTFRTNIVQMIGICKVALPHLQRGSNIINTSSVTAYKGSPGMVDYSATKGAIVAFTRALANQVMDKGIRVNSVAPGPVYTPLQSASRPGEEMEVSHSCLIYLDFLNCKTSSTDVFLFFFRSIPFLLHYYSI